MNHWPSFPSSSSWQRSFSLCLARKHLGSHLTDNGCYIMTPCFHAHRHIDKHGCQARQYKVTNGRLGSHFWPYSESLISTWWYTYNMWIVTTCCETSGRHVADMSVELQLESHTEERFLFCIPKVRDPLSYEATGSANIQVSDEGADTPIHAVLRATTSLAMWD